MMKIQNEKYTNLVRKNWVYFLFEILSEMEENEISTI